jgi:putative Mn2+ efflux pump MntP
MIHILLVSALAFLAIEFYLMASITSFIQKKFNLVDLLKLLLAPFVVAIIFALGIFIGNVVGAFYPDYSNWYAATLFFIFSIKMIYDGFKLHAVKRSVNPISNQGYFVLISFVSINAFFLGIGFGLKACYFKSILTGLIIFIFFTLVGYLIGFRMKKLSKGRYELLAALFYLITAILIAFNIQ